MKKIILPLMMLPIIASSQNIYKSIHSIDIGYSTQQKTQLSYYTGVVKNDMDFKPYVMAGMRLLITNKSLPQFASVQAGFEYKFISADIGYGFGWNLQTQDRHINGTDTTINWKGSPSPNFQSLSATIKLMIYDGLYIGSSWYSNKYSGTSINGFIGFRMIINDQK